MIPIARSILKTSIKNVPTKVSSVLYIKQNIIRKSSTIITEFVRRKNIYIVFICFYEIR